MVIGISQRRIRYSKPQVKTGQNRQEKGKSKKRKEVLCAGARAFDKVCESSAETLGRYSKVVESCFASFTLKGCVLSHRLTYTAINFEPLR